MYKVEASELRAKMSGNWLSAFSYLAPELQRAIDEIGNSVPCPIAGGTDGFRLFKDSNITGGGVKHSEKCFADGISLLMWLKGWTFKETITNLDEWLNGGLIQTTKPKRIRSKVSATNNELDNNTTLKVWLEKTWNEAYPLSHEKSEIARKYFKSRSILRSALMAKDIAFHPNLSYRLKDGKLFGYFGAILTIVRNNYGKPIGLHRTYLSSQGEKLQLPDKQSSKKLTPVTDKTSKGRYTELFNVHSNAVGICEGIETALAIYEARNFPCIPCLTATNLLSIEFPEHIDTVLHFVDKDRSGTGYMMMEKLNNRFAKSRIKLIHLIPPIPLKTSDIKSVDWADQLVRDVSGFNSLDSHLIKLLAA